MSNELAGPLRIPTGGTIGVLGGGQLGRMTAMAAAPLGYTIHVYTKKPDSPTAQVCHQATVAEFDDEEALATFAESVDVVTFEWENIPSESLKFLAQFHPVRPSWDVLETSQDRAIEKQFVNDAGIATTDWREVESLAELEDAVSEIGAPCVLKTARFGYDGKGQAAIDGPEDIESAWKEVGGVRCIVEGFVTYEAEMSVIVARSPSGQTAAFDPVENHHVQHILENTHAPAGADLALCQEAVDIGLKLAEELELEGVLAVELFETLDGRLLVNEIAPRPHNSGHWTIDACHTSQFEQFVRAVCNLPLGSPERHADAIMQNILGPIGNRWLEALRNPDANLHLYGKHEERPGRKMGHVTRIADLSEKNAWVMHDD